MANNQPLYDTPVAVLIARDGERVIGVPEPPPTVYRFAVPERCGLDQEPADCSRPAVGRRRLFRLSPVRSASVRFWRTYNEGRSRTPEGAYVYFEEAISTR